MTITLEWDLRARLSLEIRDPVGYDLHWRTPNRFDDITISPLVSPIDCTIAVDTPQSQTAQWQGDHVPIGSYEILVHFIDGCVGDQAIPFIVTVSVDGVELPAYTSVLLPANTYVAGFVLADDGSVESTGRSGLVPEELRLSTPLTTSELFAAAQPILIPAYLTAHVGNDQPYQAYVFEGQAGDRMTVRVYGISGSLDTFLALIDESGNILAINDDTPGIISTDSTLEYVRLPQTGRYLILVTRYGEFVGATEGEFDLMVSRVSG
jgi:hypothetical protein